MNGSLPAPPADGPGHGPLRGLRIVEMAGLAPAPYCALLLADMGADVICVRRPSQPPPQAHDVLFRGRPSVSIDLKTPRGQSVVRQLIDRADGLIEGFRPGVMERLGLGPEECLASNPRLVFGRLTGWGQSGPLAHAPGHDINYVALSGALHHMGAPGRPPAIPLNLLGDFAGGGLYLAFGLACALLEASRSGRGQVVDGAMVDGVASLTTFIHGLRAEGTWNDTGGSNVLEGAAPWYRTYETADGRHVSIAAVEPQFYASLVELLGLDAADLPDRNDEKNWPALTRRFADIFLARPLGEWVRLLEGTDACFAPVLTLQEATGHPHHRARAAFVPVDGVLQPAPGPRMSRTPPVRAAGTFTGAMLRERLRAWGLSAEDLDAAGAH